MSERKGVITGTVVARVGSCIVDIESAGGEHHTIDHDGLYWTFAPWAPAVTRVTASDCFDDPSPIRLAGGITITDPSRQRGAAIVVHDGETFFVTDGQHWTPDRGVHRP